MRTSVPRAFRGKRKWAIAGALALLGGMAPILLQPASASTAGNPDPSVFQLDGNALTSVPSGALGHDWDQIYNSTTYGTPGTTVSSFSSETGPDTIFTSGGSKDTNDVSSWRWTTGAVPDKDDLDNAFAARYTGSTGAQLLYFGSDRFANNGDSQMGFWFLQDRITATGGKFVTTTDGAVTSGRHENGDVLILSNFTIGGGQPDIAVYQWETGGLKFVEGGIQPASCSSGTGNYCSLVNDSTATSPWTFLDKTGSATFRPGEFYEGGINLTSLLPESANLCFASFLAETRSSQSQTSTLKDFMLSNFGTCGSTTTSTPLEVSGGSTSEITGHLSIGSGSVQVADSALVAGSGPSITTPTGTVDFYLCKTSGTCTTTTGIYVGPGSLESNGTAGEALATSPTATVTSAGTYDWLAVYNPAADSPYPKSQDADPAHESFVVDPVTPTLSTKAGTGPVLFGDPVTDTAMLSGTATEPTTPPINTSGDVGTPAAGSITFRLYGPYTKEVTPTCAATKLVYTSGTVDVSGDSATAYASTFTPTQPGVYDWVASYTGDLPNTTAPTPNPSACGDSDEMVTVRQIPTSITTAQWVYPQDSATITSHATTTLGATGTVEFSLFDNSTCAGTATFTTNVKVTGGTNSETISTANETFLVNVANEGEYYWKVVYTPATADKAHSGTQSDCVENVSLGFTNDPGAG